MTGQSSSTRSHRRVGGPIRIGAVACAALATLATSFPLAAHHSFSAEFDGTREIKITGNVAMVEWQNPHGWIHLNVSEICERAGSPGPRGGDDDKPWACRTPASDESAEWAFELASPNGLMRQGWTRNSLKEGDHITIEGSRARDDSAHGNARVVTTGDGKRLFAGSSQRTTP